MQHPPRTPHLRLLAALLGALGAAPLAAQAPAAPSDLPLVEVPAAKPGGHALALVMSGDGDWSAFTRGLAQRFAEQGIAVVGVRSRAYLSKPKSPEETARDMERVLRHYLARWERSEILLVGYSRGADFVPFVLNRLSPELKARVKVAAMMSPEVNASFEFHLSDLVKTTPRPTDIPTLPELKRVREQKEYAHLPVICVYGREEAHSLCPAAPVGMMRVEARAGGHRTSDHASFAELVLEGVGGQGPGGGEASPSPARHPPAGHPH